jgi:hypothetical protein
MRFRKKELVKVFGGLLILTASGVASAFFSGKYFYELGFQKGKSENKESLEEKDMRLKATELAFADILSERKKELKNISDSYQNLVEELKKQADLREIAAVQETLKKYQDDFIPKDLFLRDKLIEQDYVMRLKRLCDMLYNEASSADPNSEKAENYKKIGEECMLRNGVIEYYFSRNNKNKK